MVFRDRLSQSALKQPVEKLFFLQQNVSSATSAGAMDLENQKRVKEFADEFGPENLVVVLGAAEGEAAGLAAETVTAGDPTFAGPLTGVQLGLTTYHVCEPELKEEFDEAVYDEQVGMMEMVLDVDDIVDEMSAIRDEYCKYL